MSTVADSHRLVILTAQEIDELYGLPRFSDDDRQCVLPADLHDMTLPPR
jgi:hypothetical protein